jgi:hypothetical protein
LGYLANRLYTAVIRCVNPLGARKPSASRATSALGLGVWLSEDRAHERRDERARRLRDLGEQVAKEMRPAGSPSRGSAHEQPISGGLLPDRDVRPALELLPLRCGPKRAQAHSRECGHQVELGRPHVTERHRARRNRESDPTGPDAELKRAIASCELRQEVDGRTENCRVEACRRRPRRTWPRRARRSGHCHAPVNGTVRSVRLSRAVGDDLREHSRTSAVWTPPFSWADGQPGPRQAHVDIPIGPALAPRRTTRRRKTPGCEGKQVRR